MTLGIGIGPMSIEVIDAVIEYAQDNDRELMLIASRNQIDCEELGGGYVGGLTSETFAKYVREKDPTKKVLICRDHCGPYLNAAEKTLSPEAALEKTLISLKADVDAGFDLIHIDPSSCQNPYEVAEKMFSVALESGKPLQFEFGSEENVGSSVSPQKFEQDVKFVKQFVTPRYVVGQTGTLVKSTFQVGNFNADSVKKIVEIANEHGVGLKEHNADYISKVEVMKHRDLGIAAINVAPEFGVEQTKVVMQQAIIHGCVAELESFINKVLSGNKWQKWKWHGFSDHFKFLSTGHYFFASREYQFLIDGLKQKNVDIDGLIKSRIMELLDNYCV